MSSEICKVVGGRSFASQAGKAATTRVKRCGGTLLRMPGCVMNVCACTEVHMQRELD